MGAVGLSASAEQATGKTKAGGVIPAAVKRDITFFPTAGVYDRFINGETADLPNDERHRAPALACAVHNALLDPRPPLSYTPYHDVNVMVGVKVTTDRMLIGELSKRAGVTQRTVRYYEGLGLLSAEREGNGFHFYPPEALARLGKIAILKRLGLDLEEIRGVIDLYFTDPRGIEGKRAVLAILEHHLAETQQRIGDLERFQAELKDNIAHMRRVVAQAER
ncbi:MerR family transcriptional regulator [Deinococcus hopiensis]|nr:MerR family transcriptional regulator [Deinococcus hopiensis]